MPIEERIAAIALCDKNDKTRLGWKEIRDGWGSNANFFYSYGLKPWDLSDQEEALQISRAIKSADKGEEKGQYENS
eukprot:snap_masked-scaffold_41-processed-gene-0.24-mRNA-1 protein AED:0.25 eAED:1.00 QI:0/-1/0/1/-1/1/1/0/75